MSDREIWIQHREHWKKRKQENYIKSKKILDEKWIKYQEKQNWHFIIWEFDFWATTGLFIHRDSKKRWRWIFTLLNRIKWNQDNLKNNLKKESLKNGKRNS